MNIDPFKKELITIFNNKEFIDGGWVFMRYNEAVKNLTINDIRLRYVNVNANQLNIEFFIVTPYGPLWKPLGFLHLSTGSVILMNEFFEEFQFLFKDNPLGIKNLSLKENAVIAAFSFEAVQAALPRQDQKFISNGLEMDIFINFDGNPQVFISDKYNRDLGPIAIYEVLSDGLQMNPTISYKELFDMLEKTRLLTAFTIEGQSDNSQKDQSPELDFVFHSSDHLRYEQGKHVSGPHGGAPRAVKVEANISGGEGYTVTMFNTDGGQAVVQMTPKQMKLIGLNEEKIVLKGFGTDSLGSSFSDYGLTIHHNDGKIEKCILHMFDRGIDIEYLS